MSERTDATSSLFLPPSTRTRYSFYFDLEQRSFDNVPLPERLEDAGLSVEEWSKWMHKFTKSPIDKVVEGK
jgi:hypothetical protein